MYLDVVSISEWRMDCSRWLNCAWMAAVRTKRNTREFLANGYFSKATLAVEITKVRFGVKYSTTRLITLAILMNGQPV